MSSSTRTSGSSYGGQSVASAVSQLSHLNSSFSRSTQTYSLPSNKAVCGARWDARNSNFDGVANLNVNLPNPQQNKGKWVASLLAKATLSCPAPAPTPSTGNWMASYLGQSDDGVSAKATLSCPAPTPAPSTGSWRASLLAKATLSCPAPTPAPSTGSWRASLLAKATLSCPAPAPTPSTGNWMASYLGQSDDGVAAKATLSCPAPTPAPSTGNWRASIIGQSDDGVAAKATLSCPAPVPAPALAPVPSPSTGIVEGYYDYYPIVWQPPANGWVKANSVGLISNGNPSVTTCGGLFRDSSGKFMGGFSQNLHVETSYFAEVMAAFLVIKHAYHKGWHNLWLETDSLLVVHFLTSRDVLNLPWNLRQKWLFDVQAKWPYMNFNFTCTFRENNRAAIFMAEIGRHRPEFNWWNWWNIPDHEDLVKILHRDSNGFPNHYIHV